MTTRNDRNYFQRHPEYHMFLHPEYPSQEAILTARDRMLEAHPGLTFVGCHLGSLEWDVDTLASWLERFPNAAVDMAARIPPLQHQTVSDREKVRNFFIDCQDRLLYGTDLSTDGTENPARLREHLEKKWKSDWAYFATDTLMSVPEVEGAFQGLKLPRGVLGKIYSKNARKWYGIFR
jgi:predicted TIM-barrel fold metal-dependent hydrolase